MPCYDAGCHRRAYARFRENPEKRKCLVARLESQSSILPWSFNEPWVTALNGAENGYQFDYFVMLHGDVEPEHGWLDILLDEIERTEADLVSVVIPTKSPTGRTSTAVGNPDILWHPRRRLMMREVYRLPETFCIGELRLAGLAGPDDFLAVNTGCMIIDLRKSWCRETDENGNAWFQFAIDSAIRKVDGKFEAVVEDPDWHISRLLAQRQRPVVVTRKVRVNHHGDFGYTNAAPWGTWAEDEERIDGRTGCGEAGHH